jgi:hypothetical protein
MPNERWFPTGVRMRLSKLAKKLGRKTSRPEPGNCLVCALTKVSREIAGLNPFKVPGATMGTPFI